MVLVLYALKRENVMENSTIEFERKAYHEFLDWKAKCTEDYHEEGGITYLPFYMAHCL